jgi:Spy/CpxP family protein refolding chaperone
MMRKLLVLVSVMIVVGTGVVFAARNHAGDALRLIYGGHLQRGEGGFGHGAEVARLVQELGLTDAQQTQIKAIIANEHSNPVVQSLFASLKNDHKSIRDAIFSGADTSAAAESLSKDISSAIVEAARVKTQVFALLTADQQAKAKTMIANFGSHMGPMSEGPKAGGHGFGHGGMEALIQELGLSEDQKAQIKTIMENEHSSSASQTLKESLKSDREAVVNAILSDADVSAAAATLSRDLSAMIVEKARVFSSIYSILTPEQQNKVKSMKGLERHLGPRFGLF